MIYIDKFANLNRLTRFHPGEKVFYSLATLGLILSIPSPVMYLSSFLITSVIIVFYARIPAAFYFKLLLVPFYFILATVLTLIIGYSNENKIVDLGFISSGLGITAQGVHFGILIFMKSVSAIASMYFLTLTVPIMDLYYLFKKLRFPEIFLELVFLIYRFLFVMLETADKIHTSQVCRLSQKNFYSRLKAVVKTSGALFVISMKRYEERLNAMESRLSAGKILILPQEYKISWYHIMGILAIGIILFSTGFFLDPMYYRGAGL